MGRLLDAGDIRVEVLNHHVDRRLEGETVRLLATPEDSQLESPAGQRHACGLRRTAGRLVDQSDRCGDSARRHDHRVARRARRCR